MKDDNPNSSHASRKIDQGSDEIPFELVPLRRLLELNAKDGGATMEQQMEVTGWDAETIDRANTWVGCRASAQAHIQD